MDRMNQMGRNEAAVSEMIERSLRTLRADAAARRASFEPDQAQFVDLQIEFMGEIASKVVLLRARAIDRGIDGGLIDQAVAAGVASMICQEAGQRGIREKKGKPPNSEELKEYIGELLSDVLAMVSANVENTGGAALQFRESISVGPIS